MLALQRFRPYRRSSHGRLIDEAVVFSSSTIGSYGLIETTEKVNHRQCGTRTAGVSRRHLRNNWSDRCKPARATASQSIQHVAAAADSEGIDTRAVHFVFRRNRIQYLVNEPDVVIAGRPRATAALTALWRAGILESIRCTLRTRIWLGLRRTKWIPGRNTEGLALLVADLKMTALRIDDYVTVLVSMAIQIMGKLKPGGRTCIAMNGKYDR